MHCKKIVVSLAAASTAAAQRPEDTPICDYYTTALLKNNTAENQYTLLTLLVNTVVIGNYTQPNVGVVVPGILAAGKYNGTDVNLMPYFNGELKSSNRGGKTGVAVNFLDGGGAAPLQKNMPADDPKSNQYFLLTHLYQFFGALLSCSEYGMGAFPDFGGHASMYEVHKFMDLGPSELGYFIEQVALAASSFGVADSDVAVVGKALSGLFGMRCSPPATAIPAQGPQLQAICIEDTCPLSPDAVCAKYMPAVEPQPNSTGAAGGTLNHSVTPTVTMSSPATTTMGPTAVSQAGAAATGLGMAAIAGGFAMLML